jgi:hypothetical protein
MSDLPPLPPAAAAALPRWTAPLALAIGAALQTLLALA